MNTSMRVLYLGIFALATLLLWSGPAAAGSHLWRFSEFYSNADGTIQFIEFYESGGSANEFHLTGKTLSSNGNSYVFPTDLPGPTANLKFLVGTPAYASLPGVPAPDYVIAANFFDTTGDTMTIEWYDTITFNDGDVPTDGVNSMNYDFSTGVNSPTNFAGTTGTVDLGDPVPGVPWWALVPLAAMIPISVKLVAGRRHPAPTA
jgi:hypothetical protein